jgi:hypothetical protein
MKYYKPAGPGRAKRLGGRPAGWAAWVGRDAAHGEFNSRASSRPVHGHHVHQPQQLAASIRMILRGGSDHHVRLPAAMHDAPSKRNADQVLDGFVERDTYTDGAKRDKLLYVSFLVAAKRRLVVVAGRQTGGVVYVHCSSTPASEREWKSQAFKLD